MDQVISGTADWRGPELAETTSWIDRVTSRQARELTAAADGLMAARRPMSDDGAREFPIPSLAGDLAKARDALETGPGIHLVRGVPVENMPMDALRMMYWGIGAHLGTAVSQSRRGDFLGDVRDIGTVVNSPQWRGYTSNAELNFHTDSADVSGLLFVRTAKSGGLSRFVSSLAIHNEIARTLPDLLPVLHRPFAWSWQGQEPPGDAPYYDQPVYGVAGGHFASRYIRDHIEYAHTYYGAPELTAVQLEALDLIDALAGSPAFHLEMMLEPGDLVLLNNHVTYHARTEYQDHAEPELKRHLLRLWLSVPNSRPLPDGWSTLYKDRGAGAVRGGFPGRTGAKAYATT